MQEYACSEKSVENVKQIMNVCFLSRMPSKVHFLIEALSNYITKGSLTCSYISSAELSFPILRTCYFFKVLHHYPFGRIIGQLRVAKSSIMTFLIPMEGMNLTYIHYIGYDILLPTPAITMRYLFYLYIYIHCMIIWTLL